MMIAILRPSMVPIVNAMNEFDRRIMHERDLTIEQVKNELLHQLTDEGNRCVELAYDLVMSMYKTKIDIYRAFLSSPICCWNFQQIIYVEVYAVTNYRFIR